MQQIGPGQSTRIVANASSRQQSAATNAGRVRPLTRFVRRGFFKRLRAIDRGRLRVIDALGSETFGRAVDAADPDVTVSIKDPKTYLDVILGGSIGAAEAYMAGKWVASNLTDLIRLLVINRQVLQSIDEVSTVISRPLRRLAHWHRRNSPTMSRKNIHGHYDLGDDLFRQFLDPTMTYSSAVFPSKDSTLDEAAEHKLDLICQKLDLNASDHLLEIGTGWGGLAIHAAGHYGCHVTTTTISRNQFDVATERVRDAGLANRVTVLDRDYRDLEGQYDKLVSVEMIEAVGHEYLDTFFRVCRERLKPKGRMLLQAIVIADRYLESSRHSVDFIQKYIFPGGALPALVSIADSIARNTDLRLVDRNDIGLHYAHTLRKWRERFLERLGEVRRLGYPEEFIRMWEYYLCYCEGGFLERSISAVQLTFDTPGREAE